MHPDKRIRAKRPRQNAPRQVAQGKMNPKKCRSVDFRVKISSQNATPGRQAAADLVATRPPQAPQAGQSVATARPSLDARAEKRAAIAAPLGWVRLSYHSVRMAIITAMALQPFNGPKRGVTRRTRPSALANVNFTPSSLPRALARSRSIEGFNATCACGNEPPSGITCFQLGKREVVPSKGRG